MSHPYYLVTAEPKILNNIARRARSLVGRRSGDPVLAIGSHRMVLLPVAVGRMIENAPDSLDRTRRLPFADIVQAMGAQGAAPVSGERLTSLLAARDPVELGLSRVQLQDGDLRLDDMDWHLVRTRLNQAWALLGTPGQIDWGEVRVGQIDTGFRPIPALGFDAGAHSGWVLTDYDRNFFPGDFEQPDHTDYGRPPGNADSALDPLRGGPGDGHGTRTGSVLAGHDPANNYLGAAPCVPYIPVRISDSVIINHVQEPLALAIEHLTRHGCDVITLSMGMALTYVTRRLRRAIDAAYERGVILVCAAGNRWKSVVAPACLNRTLAVGGCTPALTPWLGSSFGPEVDLCAPAWPIRRATVDRKGNPSYSHGDGTSYATPQVAATAALWLRLHRDTLARLYTQPWQRVEAFKRVVTRSAQPGVEWNTRLYGHGILDARAALEAELPAPDELTRDTGA